MNIRIFERILERIQYTISCVRRGRHVLNARLNSSQSLTSLLPLFSHKTQLSSPILTTSSRHEHFFPFNSRHLTTDGLKCLTFHRQEGGRIEDRKWKPNDTCMSQDIEEDEERRRTKNP